MGKLLLKLIPEKLLFGFVGKGVRSLFATGLAWVGAFALMHNLPNLSECLKKPEVHEELVNLALGTTGAGSGLFVAFSWLKRLLLKSQEPTPPPTA